MVSEKSGWTAYITYRRMCIFYLPVLDCRVPVVDYVIPSDSRFPSQKDFCALLKRIKEREIVVYFMVIPDS